MVRVRIGDYGRVGSGNYVIESTAFTTIQIGTDDVQAKVSGDECFSCHGTGTSPFHDERHAVVYDTDECLACHDTSGNHADYLGNRVHSIHSASATGDLTLSGGLPRDWSEVTFPQQINNCTSCHTNPVPETPVWRMPDPVSCGGCHGAFPDANQEDFSADISGEIAAAMHMLTNGGDFDVTTPNTFECLVCHSEGKIADPFETHRLITFPELEEDD
jgi:nitrate reductase cytochrome c-type subunit